MSIVNGMSGMFGGCTFRPQLECTTTSIVNSTDPFGDGSLIAKYLLDGDATDLTGNYDGTENGGLVYDVGKFGQAGDFDGTDDYIDTGYTNTNILEATFSCVLNCPDYGALDDYTAIFQNSGVSEDKRYGLRVVYDGDNNYPVMWNEDGDYLFDTVNMLDYNNTLIHLVFVYSVTLGVSVYVNGILKQTVTTDKPLKFDTMNIGYNVQDSCYFKGLVDQVEVYNRALNPQEVQMLYTQSKYYCDPTQAIDGLVAHYPLDGTAEDLTGNYNGTENGVTYVESDMGIAGSFDGSDNYVDCPLVTVLDDATSITSSLWFKSTSTDVPVGALSIRGNDSNEVKMIVALNRDNAGELGLDSAHSDGFVKLYIESGDYNDGEWHNIVCYINYDTGDFTMYIDNTQVVSDTDTDISVGTIDKVSVGANYDNQYFAGNIKNVRIYNRALTEDEISTIYNYEKVTRNIVVDRGLVAYYPLKNSSEDHWVSQYDGTDNGDVSYDGVSASFDGDGDYIEIGLSSGTTIKTYSIWFKLANKDKIHNLNLTSGDDHQGELTYWDGDDNILRYYLDTSKEENRIDIAGDDIIVGEYYNLVIVTDGVYLTAYLNSIEYANSSTSTLATAPGYLGKGSNSNRYFEGSLANVRAYNRVLSPEEITTIYNTEKGEFE